jgi:hypothetical protein
MVHPEVVEQQQPPVVGGELVIQRARHVVIHLHRVRHEQVVHQRLPEEVSWEELCPRLVAVHHLCRTAMRKLRIGLLGFGWEMIFLLQDCSPYQGLHKKRKKCGRCPSVKDHFLSPRAKP